MGMTLLVGGARAGKSSLAARLAAGTGSPVTFIATAEALDDDMKARIARHRADRPDEWTTTEEPRDLAAALAGINQADTVIVDCLTLWVSNLVLDGLADDAIDGLAGTVAKVAAAHDGATFVVTNEVGMGVHPSSELGRRFRDILGRVNAIWSEAAEEAFLVVAGRAIRLEVPGGIG